VPNLLTNCLATSLGSCSSAGTPSSAARGSAAYRLSSRVEIVSGSDTDAHGSSTRAPKAPWRCQMRIDSTRKQVCSGFSFVETVLYCRPAVPSGSRGRLGIPSEQDGRCLARRKSVATLRLGNETRIFHRICRWRYTSRGYLLTTAR
jgi:hypothetical protein